MGKYLGTDLEVEGVTLNLGKRSEHREQGNGPALGQQNNLGVEGPREEEKNGSKGARKWSRDDVEEN